ncbi:hypothetical protein GTU81_11930 [Erwinia amylovora]|nr:hypothetical protein GTU81_11930 [Erwinia amylovora]
MNRPGTIRRWTRNIPARLSMVTDAGGNATSLFYDEQGRPGELVDSAGQRLSCRYLTTAGGHCRLSAVLLHRGRGAHAGQLRV